jgi:peptidoglycan/xylan/chitin deacetylase (PgdA/CDA1 family)
MFGAALTAFAAGGRRARLSILIFHRVLQEHDPLLADVPDAAQFEQCMRWIRDWFNVLPLAEAATRLARGDLPPRALSITFDDGYADNEEIAAPILRRLGLHATFFIATGFLDGRNMWNDRVIEAIRACAAERLDLTSLGLGAHDVQSIPQRRQAIDRVLSAIKRLAPERREAMVAAIEERCTGAPCARLMMRPQQVARLASDGMDIGGHTVTHPILASLPSAQARREIEEGKAALEDIVGRRITLFAYPNGMPNVDYTAEHVQMVRDAGFQAAVSTAWGAARCSADVFQLPRFTPWDRTRMRFAIRMLQNLNRTRYATA